MDMAVAGREPGVAGPASSATRATHPALLLYPTSFGKLTLLRFLGLSLQAQAEALMRLGADFLGVGAIPAPRERGIFFSFPLRIIRKIRTNACPDGGRLATRQIRIHFHSFTISGLTCTMGEGGRPRPSRGGSITCR